MKKMMKKGVCGILAISSVFACAGFLTACETSKPKVEITIEFDGQDYELEYTLYRKVAPATVEHFLWLADNGYYDGLCVHNYTPSEARIYTGAYSVDENNTLVYKQYQSVVQGYSNYKSFPHTVWMDKDKTMPLHTLYGEFKNNAGFSVSSGTLKEEFGSLVMYYNDKSELDEGGDIVQIKRSDGEGVSGREYQYNSATSMFYISLVESETTNNSYCTFAKLSSDDKDDLEELLAAIEDYTANHYSDDASNFTSSVTAKIDQDDLKVGYRQREKTFYLPNEPIVIKEVSVKKY